MAVDRPLTPGTPIGPNPAFSQLQMPQTGANGAQVTNLDDGSVEVDFDPQAEQQLAANVPHNANLAEHMEEDDLTALAVDLLANFDADVRSRSEWEHTYIKGLDLLGLKFEDRNKPWDGACGVFHPLLTESVVRFQAQTIQEIFPATGPAKAKIEGKKTSEREKQAQRVVGYMNYLATSEMKGYREETERLLFSLPIAGSAFRKMYQNPDKNRPEAMFVPAEDFVVSYGTSSLEDCERATHVMRKSANWVRKMQVNGFYRDIDLDEPKPEISEVQKKYDKMTGHEENYTFDDRHTLLEMHVNYNLQGFESPDGVALPYVITVEKSSQQVLGIRRNWREDDPNRQKRDHFVHFQYLPGFGFYGFGLVHIIGGLTKSATSLLRQLIDAGTLSNLPGGLKSRGLKIKGDDTPIQPGEWRDVDLPSGSVKDNILPLPYGEPSSVLYQLLGDLVEEGRRFASAADIKAADMNNEAPVGTTLAILEREMKVLSAVMARVHKAMGSELVLLAEIVRENGPEKYPYEVEDDHSLREDFDARIDVIPVSDPNAGTMAQRIMIYQAALQLSATAPQLYDLPHLHRQMLEVLGVEDAGKIVPTDEDLKPTDPVSENMNILKGKPVKAFMYQDHEAHIQVHMGMGQMPQIQELMANNPKAQAIMGAGMDHITEHVAFAYRQRIERELGINLPGPDEPLPEDIELRISRLVAPAAAQLTGKAQKMKQAEDNAEKSKDPIVQQRERELDLREQQQRDKRMADLIKARNDMQKHIDQLQLEYRRLDEQRDAKAVDAAVQLANQDTLAQQKAEIAGFQIGLKLISQELERMEQAEGEGT